jgi:prolyl 4-hydroxylase
VRQELLQEDEIFLLHDFLSDEECRSFIALGEQVGYEEATITTAAGPVMKKGVRDNARAILDDFDLAARLYDRARPLLPTRVRRWRFYRYDPGERFAPHYDGHFEKGPDHKSQLTFMIYLNDDFTGGETTFYFLSQEPFLSVRPERGAALVFVHWKLHEGAPVLAGRKYVLRTDVMCQRIVESTTGA